MLSGKVLLSGALQITAFWYYTNYCFLAQYNWYGLIFSYLLRYTRKLEHTQNFQFVG